MLVARATLRAAATRPAVHGGSRHAASLASRRTSCAMSAPAAPLRVTFVTGNKKKLEEVRARAACDALTVQRSLLTPRRRRVPPALPHQVVAILGTEHAHRFVLDSVSLDLPELQARRSHTHTCDVRTRNRHPDSGALSRAPPQGEPEAIVAEKARLAAQHVGCVHAGSACSRSTLRRLPGRADTDIPSPAAAPRLLRTPRCALTRWAACRAFTSSGSWRKWVTTG
jgi:hypothetical protein